MPKVTTNLRIFLSSPGDLSDERKIYKTIIDESNDILSDSNSDIRLELVTWENDTYPSLGKDAQSIINEQIGDDYDIFVGLMWTRFGTPTPRAGSGTEEEFNLALDKLTSNPSNTRILFYFKDALPESLSKIDPEQLEKVNEFKKQLQSKGLLGTYNDIENFKEISRKHLLKHAQDFRNGWGYSSSKKSKTIPEIEEELESENYLFPENNELERIKENDGIKIFPSKKVYGRLNIDEYNEWRKEFRVRYPIIEGLKSESILYKINSLFNYENVFDISIKESIEGDFWLNDLDYSILFLKRPFINILFYMEGIGAYSWTVTQSIVVDYETANLVQIKDIFKEDSLERLASIINEFMQMDLKKAFLVERYLSEIPLHKDSNNDESEQNNNWLEERFGVEKFTVEDLNEFTIDEDGISFIIHFGFPHVIKVIEPEGKYHFSFESLKQFIKLGSVLENFIEENKVKY